MKQFLREDEESGSLLGPTQKLKEASRRNDREGVIEEVARLQAQMLLIPLRTILFLSPAINGVKAALRDESKGCVLGVKCFELTALHFPGRGVAMGITGGSMGHESEIGPETAAAVAVAVQNMNTLIGETWTPSQTLLEILRRHVLTRMIAQEDIEEVKRNTAGAQAYDAWKACAQQRKLEGLLTPADVSASRPRM